MDTKQPKESKHKQEKVFKNKIMIKGIITSHHSGQTVISYTTKFVDRAVKLSISKQGKKIATCHINTLAHYKLFFQILSDIHKSSTKEEMRKKYKEQYTQLEKYFSIKIDQHNKELVADITIEDIIEYLHKDIGELFELLHQKLHIYVLLP